MENLISVKNLEKSFKENRVLKKISFDVYTGEILCILGPNGAGKSTTINILTAALNCDGGEITFKGVPIGRQLRKYKQSLGIVPQDISLYEELGAEQNLSFFASLYGLHGSRRKDPVDKALLFAGLEERRHDKVKTFSGGMKRRLNIACAVAHGPDVLSARELEVLNELSRHYEQGDCR